MADIWFYDTRGCWCADVPDAENPGRRKRLYLGADEREARRQFHQYMASYHAQEPRGAAGQEGLSLFALAARFLRWVETNLSARTLRTHKQQLRAFVQEHGHRQASDITPSDVEEFKRRIRGREGVTKARTVNFFVQSVKRMYSWGAEQGLLDDNPIKAVKRVAKDPPQDRSLSAQEAEAFLTKARESQPLGDFCEVLLHTGMRAGELLGLKWSDVDFDRRVLRVFNHKTASVGEQRPRTIPLNDRVMEILQRQEREADVVFTKKNGEPMTYNALRLRKDRLEEKHPDTPRITFHQFRHTFASNLAREDVPERVAQSLLGHSSNLMTRYYTTTPVSEMLDAVQRLGGNGSDEESAEGDGSAP